MSFLESKVFMGTLLIMVNKINKVSNGKVSQYRQPRQYGYQVSMDYMVNKVKMLNMGQYR